MNEDHQMLSRNASSASVQSAGSSGSNGSSSILMGKGLNSSSSASSVASNASLAAMEFMHSGHGFDGQSGSSHKLSSVTTTTAAAMHAANASNSTRRIAISIEFEENTRRVVVDANALDKKKLLSCVANVFDPLIPIDSISIDIISPQGEAFLILSDFDLNETRKSIGHQSDLRVKVTTTEPNAKLIKESIRNGHAVIRPSLSSEAVAAARKVMSTSEDASPTLRVRDSSAPHSPSQPSVTDAASLVSIASMPKLVRTSSLSLNNRPARSGSSSERTLNSQSSMDSTRGSLTDLRSAVAEAQHENGLNDSENSSPQGSHSGTLSDSPTDSQKSSRRGLSRFFGRKESRKNSLSSGSAPDLASLPNDLKAASSVTSLGTPPATPLSETSLSSSNEDSIALAKADSPKKNNSPTSSPSTQRKSLFGRPKDGVVAKEEKEKEKKARKSSISSSSSPILVDDANKSITINAKGFATVELDNMPRIIAPGEEFTYTNPDTQISYRTDKEEVLIMMATAERLVDCMTEDFPKDVDYSDTFFLTYKSFIKPLALFEALLHRFHGIGTAGVGNAGSTSPKSKRKSTTPAAALAAEAMSSKSSTSQSAVTFDKTMPKAVQLAKQEQSKSEHDNGSGNNAKGSSESGNSENSSSAEKSDQHANHRGPSGTSFKPMALTHSKSMKLKATTRPKVLTIVIHWLKHHWQDVEEDPILEEKVHSFLDELKEGDYTIYYQSIANAVKAQKEKVEAKRVSNEEVSENLKRNQSSKLSKMLPRLVLDLEPKELAEQLTYYDFEIFRTISRKDYINYLWPSKALKERIKANPENVNSNLDICVSRLERASFWIATEICSVGDGDCKEQAKLIQTFIGALSHCLQLNNVFTCFAIYGGLNFQPVLKLKKAWELIPKKAQERLGEVEALMNPSRNMRAYRQYVAARESQDKPMIPFLPLHLKDLVFLNDGNDTIMPDGRINFDKCRTIARRVDWLDKLAHRPYHVITPKPDFITYLDSAYICANMEELNKLSKKNGGVFRDPSYATIVPPKKDQIASP